MPNLHLEYEHHLILFLVAVKNAMIFFTADQHVGHFNIMRLSKRPFASLDEMNEALETNLAQKGLKIAYINKDF